MSNDVVGGIIELKLNGEIYLAKGNFTYNLGKPKYEPVIGADRVHGYKGTPQAARIEGEITDTSELDVEKIVTVNNATATLSLENGKIIVLKNARYTGDGDIQTEEGNIQLVLHGLSAEEIR